jgi:hypothetical protein
MQKNAKMRCTVVFKKYLVDRQSIGSLCSVFALQDVQNKNN